ERGHAEDRERDDDHADALARARDRRIDERVRVAVVVRAMRMIALLVRVRPRAVARGRMDHLCRVPQPLRGVTPACPRAASLRMYTLASRNPNRTRAARYSTRERGAPAPSWGPAELLGGARAAVRP